MSEQTCTIYAIYHEDIFRTLEIKDTSDEDVRLFIEEDIMDYWFLHEEDIDEKSFNFFKGEGIYELCFDFIFYENAEWKLKPTKAECLFVFPWEVKE